MRERVFTTTEKVSPLEAAPQGAQDFIAGAATDDGARSVAKAYLVFLCAT